MIIFRDFSFGSSMHGAVNFTALVFVFSSTVGVDNWESLLIQTRPLNLLNPVLWTPYFTV